MNFIKKKIASFVEKHCENFTNREYLARTTAKQMNIDRKRIQKWLDETGRSRDWLAEKIGASRGTVSNWLAAKTGKPMPLATLKLIERLMCDDLLGDPAFTLEEAEDIRFAMDKLGFSSLKEFFKAAVIARAREIKEKESKTTFPLNLIGLIAAGAPAAGDYEQEKIPVTKDYPAEYFALKVCGASMEPAIADGAIIVMRPCTDPPKSGDIVAYDDERGVTLKMLESRPAKKEEKGDKFGNVHTLRSLNPSFPDVEIMDGGRIASVFVEIIG